MLGKNSHMKDIHGKHGYYVQFKRPIKISGGGVVSNMKSRVVLFLELFTYLKWGLAITAYGFSELPQKFQHQIFHWKC